MPFDRIFAHEIFKDIDTRALREAFDIRKDIEAAFPLSERSPLPNVQQGPEIAAIPPEGLLIDTPGTYRLTTDVSWQPQGPGAAILICADDVSLDLGGFKLDVEAQSPDVKLVAILAAALIEDDKLHHISIQNGTIANSTLHGLYAKGISHLEVGSLTVTGSRYKNITAANITPSGILIAKSDTVAVSRCKVTDLTVTTPSCAGFQMVDCSGANLLDCAVSDFVNEDGSAQGYSFLACTDLKCSGCSADGLTTHFKGETNTIGHTAIGYVPMFCFGIAFRDCSAADITGCCDDAHGMSVFLNADVIVSGFRAQTVLDGMARNFTGAKATGLEIYGVGVQVENCSVRDIKAIRPQNLQSAGFSSWGAGISYFNCLAEDIKVLDENLLPDTTYGNGTGYGWAPDPRSEFRNVNASQVTHFCCAAQDCQVGFDTFKHVGSLWDTLRIASCDIPILKQSDGISRTMTMDQCSESPTGMPYSCTIPNTAADNSFRAVRIDNGCGGAAYPPVAPTESWSVPRVALPGLFSMQSAFDNEWWYYVGTLKTADQTLVSVQFQLLRSTLTTASSLAGALVGIGWRSDGVSSYLFSQGYGFGASTGGPLSSLENALVVPNAADHGFQASFAPLLEIVDPKGPPADPLKFPSGSGPSHTVAYTGSGRLGHPGSCYALKGSGTGFLSQTGSGSPPATADYALALDFEDKLGTVMEGLSGYVGSEMFAADAQIGVNGSYECAQPALNVTGGKLVIDGIAVEVTGGSLWMDRQMTASPPPRQPVASRHAGGPDGLRDLLTTGAGSFKPLYRGNWIALRLNSGPCFALAEFWPPLTPQWITGTKVGHPPQHGFGNMFFAAGGAEAHAPNGGRFLKPRKSLGGEDWDFDVNILDPGNPPASPHWTSPLSGHTYATALEIEFSDTIQALGVPHYLYLYAIAENCENAMPGGANHFFEGAAVIYQEKSPNGTPLGDPCGYAFIEEMGYN